jgi:hypothetical protein
VSVTAEVWHVICADIAAVPESVCTLIRFIVIVWKVVVVVRVGIRVVITSSS